MSDFLYPAALVLGLLAGAFAPADPPLERYAPDCNFYIRGSVLVGAPDRTGCPRWTLERITRRDLAGPGDRSRSVWRVDDAALRERHARDADYAGSGYSRGHLAAARLHHRSQRDMDATHTYANCVPQPQRFNAGSWARLEDHVRDLVLGGDTVWVATIPLWRPQTRKFARNGESGTLIVRTIGSDQVWVPTQIGKSLLIESPDGTIRLETYIAANDDLVAAADIDAFRVATDTLEASAMLDLWRGIPDEAARERPDGG